MNAKQLARIKQRLLDLRAELLSTGGATIEPVRRDVLEKIDEDEAPLTEMMQVIASNRNRTRAADLERIERTLRRLEEDPEEYGLCRLCDDEIAEGRLLAMPFVELCVECQATSDPSRGTARKHLTDYKG